MKNKTTTQTPTVFTNNEIGKQMQRIWLQENHVILSRTKLESETDFILVTPLNGDRKNAKTQFLNLSQLPDWNENPAEITTKIIYYVIKMSTEDKVVVIFINPEGRVSYYTIYLAKEMSD